MRSKIQTQKLLRDPVGSKIYCRTAPCDPIGSMLHLVERSSGIIDPTLGSTDMSAPDMGLDRVDAISDQWDRELGKSFVFSFVDPIVYSRPKPRPAVLPGKPSARPGRGILMEAGQRYGRSVAMHTPPPAHCTAARRRRCIGRG